VKALKRALSLTSATCFSTEEKIATGGTTLPFFPAGHHAFHEFSHGHVMPLRHEKLPFGP